MDIATLSATAKALVAPGKGILAADESSGTIKKRFDSITSSPPRTTGATTARCCSPPKGAADYISGVILFDETIRQNAADGTPLVKVLEDQGIIPGIKVDLGAKPLAVAEGETVTEGLDGLRERLAEYHELGARFAKWRATYINISRRHRRSAYCIDVNAHALARYAALCQEAGIVPIVEPEVLMDGDHTIERVVRGHRRAVLDALFDALLPPARARSTARCSSPTWCSRATACPQQASVEEVAEATVRCFRATRARRGARHRVPVRRPVRRARHRAPQRDEPARRPHPWQLSFSYGRALQAPALKAWKGEAANVDAGQDAFLHRAKLNSAARSGSYTADMEKAAS